MLYRKERKKCKISSLYKCHLSIMPCSQVVVPRRVRNEGVLFAATVCEIHYVERFPKLSAQFHEYNTSVEVNSR